MIVSDASKGSAVRAALAAQPVVARAVTPATTAVAIAPTPAATSLCMWCVTQLTGPGCQINRTELTGSRHGAGHGLEAVGGGGAAALFAGAGGVSRAGLCGVSVELGPAH
jgi:hypothetical protein